MSMEYSRMEMMTIAAARRIKDDDIVFCGTGVPLLAAVAAKKIHSPNCTVFFETGAIDPDLDEIPLSVADPRVMKGASHHGSLLDAFNFMQNEKTGSKVLGVLSGAQIDAYGNLNSTVIGPYTEASIRFPGSGGACDVASFVGRTMIFMKHEQRRFVNKLDYITSPGWLNGDSSRYDIGLTTGGPEVVISDLGVMSFDPDTKRMFLSHYYEASSLEEIADETGFELDTNGAQLEPPPSENELNILRKVVDPLRLILH